MSDLSGGAKCVKYILFVFNFLFLLAGLALIVVGAIVHVQTSKSGFSESATGAGIFIIVIGSIVFLVTFFGCAGSINNNHCMVVTYGILLLVILLAQIAAVITGFMMRDKVTMKVKAEMERTQATYDLKPDSVVGKTWNQTQKDLQCCGTTSYRTWSVNPELNETHSVPDSCCKNFTDFCGYGKNVPGTIPDNLYEKGCFTAIEVILKTYLLAVAVAAAAVGVLEILGIIFAFCLAHSLRKDYRVV
jgi:CD63 antigen